jgi:hypothetical protein
MTVVGDQHDRSPVPAGGVQQLRQEGDVLQPPAGPIAFSSVVERVVDRVQHDADNARPGQRLDQFLRQAVTGGTGHVRLVEQHCLAPSSTPERGEGRRLRPLVGRCQIPGQQAGPAEPGHGRQRRHGSHPAARAGGDLGPGPLLELLGELQRDGTAHPVQDHDQRHGSLTDQRCRDLLQHVLDQQAATRRRAGRRRRPALQVPGELLVEQVTPGPGGVVQAPVGVADDGVAGPVSGPDHRQRPVHPGPLRGLPRDGLGHGRRLGNGFGEPAQDADRHPRDLDRLRFQPGQRVFLDRSQRGGHGGQGPCGGQRTSGRQRTGQRVQANPES